MGNMTSTEIELTGENHVESWLAENGYSNITKETLFPQEKEIRATGTLENIIVLVRTFLHPNRPFKLSEYETHKVMLRASRQKNTAYAAYVVIDETKSLVGDIVWERLG
ncbi:MAG TPA: hypothetical protein DCQ97_07285 [Chitinophagaceae bacterium]|nr:hypothetical protein [Chitinophagaceae bacterium]